MKQLGDSKFGSLKSIKKALSKKNLFKSKKREDTQQFDVMDMDSPHQSPKTPVLGNYNSKKMAQNIEEEFGSFTEEEDTYSMTDFDEDDNDYGRDYAREDKLSRRSKSYGNVSHDDMVSDVTKPPRRHKSGSETSRRQQGSQV